MTKILVAYTTKHNATAEIANAIGEVLRESGSFQVDVQPAQTIEDITPYDAVVLGSAVHLGDWQPAAKAFLRKHEQELAQRPVWLFSSRPTGEAHAAELLKGWKFPKGIEPIVEQIKPREIVVFHGKLDMTHLNMFERATVNVVKAPIGDFRNWEMIQSWATTIAQVLLAGASQTVVQS